MLRDLAIPDFLIIGASKAGTTSLWSFLRKHPQIFMPAEKEPCFFADDSIYAKGGRWYKSLFQSAPDGTMCGEASPHYTAVETYPRVVERIAAALPDARLIYIVRHPLCRIESAWKQCLHTNHPMPRAFPKAVRQYRNLIEQSLYWRNINAYRSYFPDDQIMILFFEQFIAAPQVVLDQVCGFLGVGHLPLADSCSIHANPSASKQMRRPVMDAIGRLVPIATVADLVPYQLRRALHPLTHTKVPSEAAWDADTLAWTLDQLRDDTEALLRYCGKPIDFWQLNPNLTG